MTYPSIPIRMQWRLASQGRRCGYTRSPLFVEQWVWNASDCLPQPAGLSEYPLRLRLAWFKRDKGQWQLRRAVRLPLP